MQGNEAAAWAAIDAGARFYAGYPITPSSEIAEKCAELLPLFGGIYLQMEDEIASMAAVIGASLSGVKAFTATSGPGFSLMQENLGVAIYQEVPCVVINVMRVGPSTGLATRPAQGDVMQARWGTHGDHAIIALSPESVQEMYDLTVLAFNLAERYRTPVILLSDEIIAHMREKLIIPPLDALSIENRKRPRGEPKDYLPYKPEADLIPPMASYGGPYLVHASSTAHDYTGYSNFKPEVAQELVRRLHRKIDVNRPQICRTELFGPPEARTTLIAYGAVARAAKQAVVEANQSGGSANLLRLITLWPFPEEEVRRALARARAVVVPEMNLGQIILEVERVNRANTPVHHLSRTDGEPITPEEILTCLAEVNKTCA
jgi:2-oxoglutarate ferredoxin oxidoreductase subunit alpha